MRIRSRGRVGSDVFDRLDLVDDARPDQPRGLVDDLDWFATPQFDPSRVDDRVRTFYERAGEYRLDTRVRASSWFRPALWVFSQLARRVGQTDFPVGVPLGGSTLTNRIYALRDVAGRPLRAWVRTWRVDGPPRVLYAAAYSSHGADDQRFLDIAFPFPAGTLTSILRFVDSDRGGTELTTDQPPRHAARHAGIWWVGRRWHLRLPMSERIRVWPGDAPGLPTALAERAADVVAEHHIRLFGRVILTLHYIASLPSSAAASTTRTN